MRGLEIYTQRIAIKYIVPEDELREEAKNKIKKIKKKRKNGEWREFFFSELKKMHTISEHLTQLAKTIFNNKITLDDDNKDQADLLIEIMNFNKKIKPKGPEKKKQK